MIYRIWNNSLFGFRPPSLFNIILKCNTYGNIRRQCPSGLTLESAAVRLLMLWVRIPPGEWMSVFCECWLLLGRSLRDVPITHPEESYRLWCGIVCDLETSRMRRPWPALGCWARGGEGGEEEDFENRICPRPEWGMYILIGHAILYLWLRQGSISSNQPSMQ
jgi:hypothetical protein